MYKRILVPLDGSKLAEAALTEATRLAAANDGAQLLLLRVFEPEQMLAAPTSSFDTYHLVVSIREAKKRAESYLKTLAEAIDRVPVETLTAESISQVGGTIADEAFNQRADLIVMTTHGYTGFRKFVMGSVTAETLKRTPCPVLVIPADRKF